MTDSQLSERRAAGYAFTISPRLYTVPLGAVLLGTGIGLNRGGRLASLRFLAENAHRTPTTQKGWYYYHKTKNYRIFLGGATGGRARRRVPRRGDAGLGGAGRGTEEIGLGASRDERGRSGNRGDLLRAIPVNMEDDTADDTVGINRGRKHGYAALPGRG
ncbi:Non-specific serine/threonine protein kinase [Mycena venus]|uniref:Non-specific serine/threonine protein kinase n=1 Tax=Mycena venus TaxID=2733690 RepID=A0A8H7CWK7_9AGAR|nr:Non-specific serine/threonine protein kinase [Mycena venus]